MGEIMAGHYNKDFHSHILPAIDDGASTVEESLILLNSLKKQGVETIVATPHFYLQEQRLDSFIQNREYAYRAIMKASDKTDIPNIIMGAEVYYHPILFSVDNISELCIGKSPYILLELPHGGLDKSIVTGVEKFINYTGLIPVLAHIEIYPPKIIDYLMQLPLLGQINLPSFLDLKKKKAALKLVQKGYCHVLGTDCHNIKYRPPYFRSGMEAFTTAVDNRFIKQADETAAKILGRI